MAVIMNAKTQSWEFLVASFMVIIIRQDPRIYIVYYLSVSLCIS
jgi:hypothetical protein